MKGYANVIKWMATLVTVFAMGCLPYSNRTSYNAFNIRPTTASAADTTHAIVIFNLTRESTQKILPFFYVLGEKGDFRLEVVLYGEGSKRYRTIVLKSIRIESGGRTHFAVADTNFVTKQQSISSSTQRHYTSGYVIALDDSIKKAGFRVKYDLITQDNQREEYTIQRQLHIDRTRGLAW